MYNNEEMMNKISLEFNAIYYCCKCTILYICQYLGI